MSNTYKTYYVRTSEGLECITGDITFTPVFDAATEEEFYEAQYADGSTLDVYDYVERTIERPEELIAFLDRNQDT